MLYRGSKILIIKIALLVSTQEANQAGTTNATTSEGEKEILRALKNQSLLCYYLHN